MPAWWLGVEMKLCDIDSSMSTDELADQFG
jgi:hypothetical protein